MKLISWNVNGLRSVLKKGFMDFMVGTDFDILCLQEIRARPDQVAIEWPNGFVSYWNPAQKPGYAGTLSLCRKQPINVTTGIGDAQGDSEGRVLTLEFAEHFLINVYTPNAKRDLSRLAYRSEVWDVAFLKYLKSLEKTKPVIFCGDLNVAHREIDLANPKSNRRNAGFTDEERAGMSNYINAGFLDTFREFNQDGGNYTWWSYRANSRERNVGWRIDYFCLSKILRPKLKDAFISPHVGGSDHCPMGIVIE